MLIKIRKNLKQTCFIVVALFLTSWAVAQTNPTPQSLPYSQNFSTLAASSATYPAGWQGWTLAASAPTSTHISTVATADRTLTASSTAATSSGNVHNYNGKIGFLSTGSLNPTLAFSINTVGKQDIVVTYDMMLIRNPFDGTAANNRTLEAVLQYRVGITGAFTTIAGTEYLSNSTLQTTALVTPVNSTVLTTTLPSACNNQSEVQLRWSVRQSAGSAGGRPSFAIDNVSASGTDIPAPSVVATGSLTAMSTTEGVASAEQSFTVSGANLVADLAVTAPSGFEVSTSALSGYASSIFLTPVLLCK